MDEDRDALAAEYVLGTLDPDERAQADALMVVDPGFAAIVRGWERRLGELNVLVSAVDPPPALWERIKSQVADVAPSRDVRLPEVAAPKPAGPESAPAPAADVVDLTQRMRRWRGLTVITGTLAACFVGIVLAREYRPDVLPPDWRHKPEVVERIVERPVEVVKEVPAARPAQLVAVFTDRQENPAFVMSFDIEKQTATVRRVAAEEKPGRVYQLWIATEENPAPRSLAVLQPGESIIQSDELKAVQPAAIAKVKFGISDEEAPGSATGRPADGALHAQLVTPPPPP